MSAAAARVGMTQSAVSQSIRHLEEQLGVVLLDRTRRPLRHTPAGLALLTRGRSLLADSSAIRSEVVEASLGIGTEVSIGLVGSFAAACGPSFIKHVAAKTFRLAVRTGITPYQEQKLFGRELDIVVTTDALQGLDWKVDRRIYSEELIVLTPKETSLTVCGREALHTLAATLSLIRFSAQSHLGIQIETLLRRMRVRAALRFEVDSADTQVAMVAKGLGWAITTPSCLVQGVQHVHGVNIAFLSEVQAGRSIYVLGRTGEHERLFDASYEAARAAVKETLLPTLHSLVPDLSGLIELADEFSQITV